MKQKYIKTIAAALLAIIPQSSVSAKDYVMGQIVWLATNYCPLGSMEANGATLRIAEHPELSTLYGNYFGGDGIRTFKLPDLRVAVPVGKGKASSGNSVRIGQRFGGIGCVENQKCEPEYQTFVGITACVMVDAKYPRRD